MKHKPNTVLLISKVISWGLWGFKTRQTILSPRFPSSGLINYKVNENGQFNENIRVEFAGKYFIMIKHNS